MIEPPADRSLEGSPSPTEGKLPELSPRKFCKHPSFGLLSHFLEGLHIKNNNNNSNNNNNTHTHTHTHTRTHTLNGNRDRVLSSNSAKWWENRDWSRHSVFYFEV